MASKHETMKRRGFYCSDILFDKLQSRADESGTPVAEHIRAAIEQYLKTNESDRTDS